MFASLPLTITVAAPPPLGLNVGMNLTQPAYYSAEFPFMNLMRQTGNWSIGSGSLSNFYATALDANGWPTTLAGFTNANFWINADGVATATGLSAPNGNYVMLYSGGTTSPPTFTLTRNGSSTVTLVSSATGRIVWNVQNQDGAGQQLTCTNVGSPYATNWAILYSPDSTATTVGVNEQAYINGAIFNPVFLQKLAGFKCLRFVNWLEANNNFDINWADRPVSTWAFWCDPVKFNLGNGGQSTNLNVPGPVPYDICYQLCNAVGCDCWIHVPMMATDDYVTQMATQALSVLNAPHKLYVECANEIWNQAYPASFKSQVQTLATPLFPGVPTQAPTFQTFAYVFAYGTMRAIQSGTIFKDVWGAQSSRIVRVLGGQISFNNRNRGLMSATCDGTHTAGSDQTSSTGWFGSIFASFTGSISGTTLTISSAITGTVGVHQQIFGTGVAAATYIVSGSGTTWTLNKSQNVSSTSMTASFWKGSGASNSDIFAIAPYFGNSGATSTVVPDTATLDQLFQEILTGGTGFSGAFIGSGNWAGHNGIINNILAWTSEVLNDCANPFYGNGMALAYYEGGQSFLAAGDNTLLALFGQAMLDPRMHTAYQQWLQGMANIGPGPIAGVQGAQITDGSPTGGQGAGLLMNHYNDVQPNNAQFGWWGVLGTIYDPPASSPRYLALIGQ